jgi:parallel beta-helix repeat protein
MKNPREIPPFFIIILLLTLVFISNQLSFIPTVNSSTSTEISFSPPHTIVKIEENFTVYIQLNNIPPFTMVSISITYNSTVLDALNATVTLPDGDPYINIEEPAGIIDIIWIGQQPLEGNQTLAQIIFKAIISSNSTLHFSAMELYDPQNNFIPCTTTDGTVEILGPLSITVQSIQASYYLGQNVTLYGNVTIQRVPIVSLIGMEVHTLEGTILIRTTKSGDIPPSTQWPIEVLNFYSSDEYGNPQSIFTAGQKAYLTINVVNQANEMMPVLISINGFDKYNTPFGLNFIQTLMSPNAYCSFIIELFIPIDCPNGNAIVYLNIFSDWPRNGGTPYQPEESTSFQITGGSTSTPPSLPPTNQTFTANYNLSFRLPSSGGLANWEVYATAFYKIQGAQAQTNFVAANIFVDDDGSADFKTIQAAINAANHRDTIYVHNGTYRENIIVNKTLSIIGESNYATVIDGTKLDTVIKITADHVNIINLQIINSSSTTDHNIGVSIFNYSCMLMRNLIANNTIGIKVQGFAYTVISENKIDKNVYGIVLYNANYTCISKNEITNNNVGIFSHGTICSNNTITNEAIMHNDVGVQFTNTTYSLISDSSIINNNYGIVIMDPLCYQNTINKNNVSLNMIGITLNSSSNNGIIENSITNNTNYGVWLFESNNNQIYSNNFVDNAHHTYCSAVINQWNSTYPAGGNYWSDYTGIDEKSGPTQDQPGSDGIGDTPYQIWELENVDYYPLMRPTYEQDIGVTDIFLSKNLTAIGYPMRIHVRIVNYGSERQTFTLTIYFNNTYLNSALVNLAGRSFTTITFWWYPTGAAPANYTIGASASTVKSEKNITNNQLVGGSVMVWPLVGDFDCNRRVGPSDFARLSWCYNSKPGDPRWYPNADLNEDGRISAYDFAVFSVNYNKYF